MPKCEVSTFTHYDDIKGNEKCKKCVVWGLGVTQGNITIDRVHTTFYSTSIETMHTSCTVFELSLSNAAMQPKVLNRIFG